MQLPALTTPLAPPSLTPVGTANGAISQSINNKDSRASTGKTEETQSNKSASESGTRQSGKQELTEADYRAIAELKKIDREVRAHEQAHLAAAGGLARGGASFSYTQGPDGQRYAVSGEVSIDTSPGRNPEATLLKAQRIQAAALAPAQPSSADRAVAASAAQMAANARAELFAERLDPQSSETESEAGEINTREARVAENNTSATETPSNAPGDSSASANELVQLIRQATTTQNAVGNLLNTAV